MVNIKVDPFIELLGEVMYEQGYAENLIDNYQLLHSLLENDEPLKFNTLVYDEYGDEYHINEMTGEDLWCCLVHTYGEYGGMMCTGWISDKEQFIHELVEKELLVNGKYGYAKDIEWTKDNIANVYEIFCHDLESVRKIFGEDITPYRMIELLDESYKFSGKKYDKLMKIREFKIVSGELKKRIGPLGICKSYPCPPSWLQNKQG